MKPYYEHAGITIYHGDCRDVLPVSRDQTAVGDAVECPDIHVCADHMGRPLSRPEAPAASSGLMTGNASVAITDPPYGETALAWDNTCKGWQGILNSASLWCFGSMRFFLENLEQFDGWRFGQELVWEKQNGSGFCVERFNRVHELCLHWYRGPWTDSYHSVPRIKGGDVRAKTDRKRGLTPHRGIIGDTGYTDDGLRLIRSVIRCRNTHKQAEHPTQKPLELLRVLVEYSCPTDGLVIDPFMGSGTTLIAAKQLGRRAIGIEIEEKYCEIAAKRLSQEVLQFTEGRELSI